MLPRLVKMRKSRFSYRTLVIGSLLGPALLFAAMAWWSWQRVDSEARASVARTADLLHEQAQSLLEADALLLMQIDDRVTGMAWPGITAQTTELRDFLGRVSDRAPGVSGAFLADADGVVRVLTLRDPALVLMDPQPAATVRQQRYFEAARAGASMVLDGPFVEPTTGSPILRLSRRLQGRDGSFRGIAVLTIAPRVLIDFWSDVVAPGDAVVMVREDGVVLARFPRIALREGEEPPRFSAAAVAALQSSSSGVIDTVSALDGIARISGYRKLQAYPAYVFYAIDKRNVARDWYPTATAFGALAAAAAGGLLLTSLVVIRRARGEAEALRRAEVTALALRQSEASARTLFRNAPVPMHALDAEGRILDVNDRWLELLGRSRQEVIGQAIADFEAPDAARDDTAPLGDAHHRYLKQSGEFVDALVATTIERDASEAFARSISVVSDITDRLRAEEATRREQKFSEHLSESSTDGIVGVDVDFRFTVWNAAMEAFSGIGREMVIGRKVFELRPDLIGTPLDAALHAALEGRKTALYNRPFAFPRTGRNGRFDADIAPLYAPDRSVMGALIFLRDITERLRTEEQLRQAQKMEVVGQLTGGVAHDFNNLLTVVLGSIDALRRRVATQSVPKSDLEFMRLADAAWRASERGALLTKRLLAFSRRQPLEPVSVDPNRLVTGMSDLLHRTLGERIGVETILAAGLWRTLVDPNQLENAILNLAVNARDAMPEGGKLTLETANAFLDEAYARAHDDLAAGQYVMLAVSDTGSGMPAEVAEKAFEPFFTTKGVGQGTGLGLSQVYGFVKQSGGHVKIYSELGQGTTVKIYLPRLISAEAPARTPGAPKPASSAAAEGELILVVEDDEDVRAHAVHLLRALGYEVLAAADGAAALRLIESEPRIRLMFTDVGLPGGRNGREVAELALRLRPDLRVLFTTGYARNAIVHQGRLDPGVELIVKPFTSEAVAAKLREILDAPAKADSSEPA
jgi:PAS domain S-box-containing protein